MRQQTLNPKPSVADLNIGEATLDLLLSLSGLTAVGLNDALAIAHLGCCNLRIQPNSSSSVFEVYVHLSSLLLTLPHPPQQPLAAAAAA